MLCFGNLIRRQRLVLKRIVDIGASYLTPLSLNVRSQQRRDRVWVSAIFPKAGVGCETSPRKFSNWIKEAGL